MNQNMSVKNRNALMCKIMELDFAKKEMVLFLDTHGCDKNALALYHKYADKSRELKEYYNKNFEYSDIRAGVVAAISVKVEEPVFESQTKIWKYF